MAEVIRRFSAIQGVCSTTTPVLRTRYAPGCIAEASGSVPQRNLQPAPLCQAVIAWDQTLALGAVPTNPGLRLQFDFDLLDLAVVRMHPHLPYTNLTKCCI